MLPNRGEAMKILVVDDDGGTRTTLSRFLSHRGYSLQTATGGREGLDLLERKVVDFVICDLQMPGMDGLEFVQVVRRRFPDIPVAMMMGNRDMEHVISAFRKGVFDFFKKPIDLKELLDCVLTVERRLGGAERHSGRDLDGEKKAGGGGEGRSE